MTLEFAPAGLQIESDTGSDDGAYVSDSFDDFDEFDEYDGAAVRRVEASDNFDDFDEFESLDNLDDDGFDAARAREEERTRREDDRREAAEQRRKEEEARRSRYEEDLDRDRDRDRVSSRDHGRIQSTYTERQRVAVMARVGTSGFQALQFITYGGELAFGVGDSARISTGLEAFSVKREFDAEQCEIEGVTEGTVVGCTRWNTILPFHVGARYQRSDTKVRPYFGGDLTLTPYTEDFQIAFGFRGRGGVDFVPTDVFGINLNAGVGLLHGSQMQSVQKDMANTGLLWQISAGTVFML
jgi:hypothetical protein